MLICRVIGTAVSTAKRAELEGYKLLVVQEITHQDKPMERTLVAIDTVGAGEGEAVLVTVGSAASLVGNGRTLAVDACIVGILDSLHADGKPTYLKRDAK